MVRNAALFWLWTALTAGCSGALPLEPATATPGIDGEVRIEERARGIADVYVRVGHLPRARQLGYGLGEYVVWVEGPGGLPRNVGTLDHSPAEREGELECTVRLDQFRLFITAERVAYARHPSDTIIATRTVNGWH